MSTLRIQLLGGFHLFWEDARLTTLSAPRTQSVLAYLLLHSELPHARRGLAFLLWTDSSERQAQTNLRRQLHFLRNGLPDEQTFLVIDHETVGWREDAPYTLDVADFRSHLAAAEEQSQLGNEPAAIASLEQVIDCYRGDLLPDCYDDWLLTIREELRQQYVGALDHLMRRAGAAQEYVKAIAYGQRLLQSDPLREETYRRLMELHLQAGERAKALAVYHECASVLARELGVAASMDTTQIYEKVLAHELVVSQPPIVHPQAGAEPTRDDAHKREAVAYQGKVASPRATPPMTLVGRQAEWQALLDAWHHAVQGHAQMVMIQGEAGIGKSRLAEELAIWIRYRDMDLAVTRSYAAAGDLAYTPVIDWLRSPRVYARLGQLLPEWLAEVARLMPELRLEFPDLAQPPPLLENWQRQRLFEALARGFTTSPRPLLLVLDDLHWCDAESLTWIEYFLQFCAQSPILLVCTLRSEDREDNAMLAPLLNRLQAEEQLVTIDLERLDQTSTNLLAQQVRPGTWREQELEQIFAYTQGNPFFVVETLRANIDVLKTGQMWADAPDLELSAKGLRSGLPAKVFALITARLSTLSADAHKLAQQMAVFGRACTVNLLAVASGAHEDLLVYCLDELWQRRIVRESSSGKSDWIYDFSHDRIRDVVYSEMSVVMRRLYHRRAALALESEFADSLQGVYAQLARHHAQAGQLARAKHYYQAASRWAAGNFAHADALRLVAQGLALCGEDPVGRYEFHGLRERIYHVQAAREQQQEELMMLARLADQLEDDRRRSETAIRQAEYALGAGQYALAGQAADQAIATAQRAQSTQLEAEGLIQRGMVCWNQGNYPAAGIFYERALKLARADDDAAIEAKILQHLGALQAYCGTVDYARRISQQALEAAQRIQDREGEIWALNQLAFGVVEQGEGDYKQALANYDRALALARASGYRAYEAKILSNTSTLHVRCGNYRAVSACLENSLAIAQETGSSRHRAFALAHLGVLYSEMADCQSAQDYFAQALHLFREIGYRQGEGKTLSDRSWVQILLGNHSQALADADEALRIAQAIHLPRDQAYAHTRRGYALESLQQYTEATGAYQEAIEIYEQTEQVQRGLEPQAGLVRLALAKQRLEDAQRLAKPIVQIVQNRTLDATSEALWVYETCRRVCAAAHDPAAQAFADQIEQILAHRAATIADPARRAQFQAAQTQVQRVLFPLPAPEQM